MHLTRPLAFCHLSLVLLGLEGLILFELTRRKWLISEQMRKWHKARVSRLFVMWANVQTASYFLQRNISAVLLPEITFPGVTQKENVISSRPKPI